MAQSVLAPPPLIAGESTPAPAGNAVQAGITTGAAAQDQTVAQGAVGAAPLSTTAELLSWGQVHMKTHVTYQLLYASGVQSSPGEAQNTFTHTLNPGVAVFLGSHWMLDYEPSLQFYSDSHFHNTFDQSVSLAGGTTYGNWTFGLSQNYSRSDDPQVQTASQTGLQSYTAGLNASYHFSDKWSLESGGGVALTYVDETQLTARYIIETNGVREVITTNSALSDLQNYFASEWLNYQLDPKIGVALGISGGYSDQTGGLSTMNEQYLGRLILNPGTKLTITADGGIEDQQFLNSSQPEIWTPIFAASAAYHLFDPTTLALSAARSVQPPLFQSQIVTDTSIGVALQQRLLSKLQLSLSYSYFQSDYMATKVFAPRSDTGNAYQAALSMAFLKHGSIGTFYEYTQNSSNVQDFGYSSHQAGLTLTWAY